VGTPRRGEVVVVPGLCVASYLRPACSALAAEGYRVWLVEPPGWPRSGRPAPEPRCVADLAEWVATWLVERGLRDVVLVGQSMGAQVAGHVAARIPDRVRTLVLQGPVFDPAYRTVARALGRWLLDLPRERPMLAAREVPEWVRVGPRRVWRNLRLSLTDRLEQTVTRVRCPVLVVVGEHDTLAGRAWAASLASADSGFLVLRGLPHSSPHTDPEAFVALIRHHC
jgi:pimeloyl-ACP methyl ester carboxylesterase